MSEYILNKKVYKCKHCQDTGFIEIDKEKSIYGYCICHPLVLSGRAKPSNPYLRP